MPCDDLQAGLSDTGRRSGMLTMDARPSGEGICRSYNFSPPVIIPASQIVSFADEAITTFAGDFLYSF